jgi:dephospho-CoA kinase
MFPSAVKGFINPKIDRKEISKIVFNDKDKLNRLTDTITPLVLQEIIKRAKKIDGTVFVEVPILFEKGYQSNFDKVIIIKRDKNSRIESVKIRSKLTEQEVLDRISNQFDYENSDLSSFITVINDNGEKELKEKLLQAIKNI